MVIAAGILTAFSAFLIVRCLMERHRRKGWAGEKTVRLPFFLGAVGMVCGGVFCAPTILLALDGDWMILFFGGVVLMGDSMMLAYCNCVIRYDDRSFRTRNFFGITRTCDFGDVEGIRGSRDRRIYFNGHFIFIDQMSIGADDFMEALDKGHKRATGKWVALYQRKIDPMNGNLEHPWGYFILWVVMAAVCIAIPLISGYAMYRAIDPADIVTYEGAFVEYKIDGTSLMLYADGQEKPFEIGFYRDYGDDLPAPEALCNGSVYTVGVEEGHYYVHCLTGSEGSAYITLETERQVYRASQKTTLLIISACFGLGAVFAVMGIMVARNPEKFPLWVCRCFYKKNTLR